MFVFVCEKMGSCDTVFKALKKCLRISMENLLYTFSNSFFFPNILKLFGSGEA